MVHGLGIPWRCSGKANICREVNQTEALGSRGRGI